MDIGPAELAIVVVILLLLFGGKKIPELARSLGQAQREFRRGMTDANTSTTTDDGGTDMVDAPALEQPDA